MFVLRDASLGISFTGSQSLTLSGHSSHHEILPRTSISFYRSRICGIVAERLLDEEQINRVLALACNADLC